MIVHRNLAPLLALALPLAIGCGHLGGNRVADSGPPVEIPVEQEQKYSEARDELKDPSRFFLTHAKLLEGAGKYAEARKSYATVLKEDPRSKDALLGLARMDHLSDRTAEAEDRYNRLAATYPNDSLVLDAIGQFHADQKRWPEAIRFLERAAANAPNDRTVNYHLAVATARSGDVERARPLFARSVGPAETHYNLGYILFEEGRFDLAEREFIAAIAAKPELEQAQVLLGEVRAKRGQPNEVYASKDSWGTDVKPAAAGTGDRLPGARTASFPTGRESGVAPAHRPAVHTTPNLARAMAPAPGMTPEQPTHRAADFQRPVGTKVADARTAEFEQVPAWDPMADWGPEPHFEQPVRATSNGYTPAQLEQMRNQR